MPAFASDGPAATGLPDGADAGDGLGPLGRSDGSLGLLAIGGSVLMAARYPIVVAAPRAVLAVAGFGRYCPPVQTVAEIKSILQSRGLAPRKALGQNFLIEHAHLQRLIDRAAITNTDTVLEVGPGTGTLTDELMARAGRVVACELDAGLAAHLRDRYAAHGPRFTLIEGDALGRDGRLNDAARAALAGQPFKLVANLPYQIASPLMVGLALDPLCRGQYVTIQREVGQRLRATPGTRDYSELSVMVQAMCRVERVATLPPGCFWPPPKVTSEMLAIEPLDTPHTAAPAALARLCRTLFTQRRKTLRAILGGQFAFPAGIDPSDRPEALPVPELVRLAQAMPPASPAEQA
jgi:16S rRNA (adenine1518-N6/adenine1519-N6)-dimethyltransferase